jgi:hypothetical protein
MPVIYSEIQLFDGDQSVYKVDDNGRIHLIAKAPLESLAAVITDECYAKSIYRVKLFSTFSEMCQKVKAQISEKENTKFSENKITVEVNA